MRKYYERKYLISIFLISIFITQTACGLTNSKLCVDQVGNKVKISSDASNIPS